MKTGTNEKTDNLAWLLQLIMVSNHRSVRLDTD